MCVYECTCERVVGSFTSVRVRVVSMFTSAVRGSVVIMFTSVCVCACKCSEYRSQGRFNLTVASVQPCVE